MEPQNPTVPISPQPAVPPTPAALPKNNNFLVVFLSVLLLITLSTTGYLFLQVQELSKELTNFQIQTTPVPSATPDPTVDWKTYLNPHGLSLSYPNDWNISLKSLKAGERLIEKNRYDITATYGAIEIADLTKNGWTLRVISRDAVSELGGFGPISSLDEYEKITVAGRTALRTKVENGFLPFIANHPEPYPFPILFQRLPNESNPPSWKNPDSQGSYVPLFSINDSKNKTNLEIVIYSDFLTKETIESKQIDSIILQKIDQILSTFHFLE